MFISIFKNFIILLTSLYLTRKVGKSSTLSVYNFVKYVLISLLFAIAIHFLKEQIPYIAYFAPAICLVTFTCITEKKWSLSTFCISLSSYVINLLIFHVVAFVICSLLVTLFNIPFTYINEITIVICILYPLLIVCTLKIKPVYKSISALIFNGMINYNTIICLISLGILTLEQMSPSEQHLMRRFRALMLPICLVIILYWWRTQISKNYKEKLRLLEIKALRSSKAEDETYISKLEAENKRL